MKKLTPEIKKISTSGVPPTPEEVVQGFPLTLESFVYFHFKKLTLFFLYNYFKTELIFRNSGSPSKHQVKILIFVIIMHVTKSN